MSKLANEEETKQKAPNPEKVVEIRPDKGEKLDNFYQVIRLHKEESEEFLENQVNGIDTWDKAWRELIYCILAGTQISTDIVQKSYFNLISSYKILRDYREIKKHPEKIEAEIVKILKRNGYRFYRTKPKTLINAALYFENLIKQYPDFKNLDWYNARVELIKNVKGIGNKIASHWLRNIGFSLPIIDIHVRRVLSCANLINEKYSKYQITENEYWELEERIIEISNKRFINVAKLDYILWKHGRDYCVHKACSICPLNPGKKCIK